MPVASVNRPTTRGRLLAAGRELAVKRGLRGLTVREIAAAADANLGSFVYHFGTRDAFVKELIEVWYAPLFARVKTEVNTEGPPMMRLRRAILQLVDFGMEHDEFMGRLLVAAADTDKPACDFVRSLARRHPRMLLQLVKTAQAEGSLIDEDPMQVMCFLMASVALPRLVASAWAGPPLFGKELSSALSRIARDRDRVVQRLDWALRGVTLRGC